MGPTGRGSKWWDRTNAVAIALGANPGTTAMALTTDPLGTLNWLEYTDEFEFGTVPSVV